MHAYICTVHTCTTVVVLYSRLWNLTAPLWDTTFYICRDYCTMSLVFPLCKVLFSDREIPCRELWLKYSTTVQAYMCPIHPQVRVTVTCLFYLTLHPSVILLRIYAKAACAISLDSLSGEKAVHWDCTVCNFCFCFMCRRWVLYNALFSLNNFVPCLDHHQVNMNIHYHQLYYVGLARSNFLSYRITLATSNILSLWPILDMNWNTFKGTGMCANLSLLHNCTFNQHELKWVCRTCAKFLYSLFEGISVCFNIGLRWCIPNFTKPPSFMYLNTHILSHYCYSIRITKYIIKQRIIGLHH